MNKIAFLGLGNMGLGMATNLVRAGHTVTGFDPAPAALGKATERGIVAAPSAREAAGEADVIVTMLPSGKHVMNAYADLVTAAPRPALFLDCSTIDVADARAAADIAIKAGHLAADAPVSGGTAAADNGLLTFMVGGTLEAVVLADPLLSLMGAKIVRCGESGAGQAAKICNNMILGISMIAVSEAFALGARLGLTDQALFDVSSAASGQCWALTTNCPVPGPVPTSPGQPRLRGWLHQRIDAERPPAGAIGRREQWRRHRTRTAGHRTLRSVRRARWSQQRLLGDRDRYPCRRSRRRGGRVSRLVAPYVGGVGQRLCSGPPPSTSRSTRTPCSN